MIYFLKILNIPTTSEFYNQFKNNTEEGKRVVFKLGQESGELVKSSNNIREDNLETIADILNAMDAILNMGRHAKVEENRVVVRNTAICYIMRASLTLGIPLEWLDINYVWPYLEGLVSTIRSDVTQKIPLARCRGYEVCMYV